jgi:hypothetical protein
VRAASTWQLDMAGLNRVGAAGSMAGPGRARAKAAELTGRMKTGTARAGQQAATRTASARSQFAGTTATARQAAAKGASTARQRPIPLAVAVALVVGFLVIWQWRKR